MNRNKQTEVLGGIITAIILILLIFLSNIESGKLSFVEGFANTVVSPIQILFISGTYKIILIQKRRKYSGTKLVIPFV